jgi:preprotein translocase subunit YajC
MAADTITLQDTEKAPTTPDSMDPTWISIIPWLLIFMVFYFLLFRPQEKRRREQEKLISGVKKGEEVLTNTGLFGIVTKIDDSNNTIMVQVANNVEIKMLKSSIANIVSREEKQNAQKEVKTKEVKKPKNK